MLDSGSPGTTRFADQSADVAAFNPAGPTSASFHSFQLRVIPMHKAAHVAILSPLAFLRRIQAELAASHHERIIGALVVRAMTAAIFHEL
jgi:hypothetical protein